MDSIAPTVVDTTGGPKKERRKTFTAMSYVSFCCSSGYGSIDSEIGLIGQIRHGIQYGLKRV